MPQDPDFEYTYRWAEGLDADALEARDQALEQKMLDGYGSSCVVDFEYPYRWHQILATESLSEQIQLLEDNMTALEAAVNAAGGCTLEFPFRWYNFWEALLAGEAWAIGIAEENDRAIEMKFGRCSCGCSPGYHVAAYTGPSSQTYPSDTNPAASVIDETNLPPDIIPSFGGPPGTHFLVLRSVYTVDSAETIHGWYEFEFGSSSPVSFELSVSFANADSYFFWRIQADIFDPTPVGASSAPALDVYFEDETFSTCTTWIPVF